MSYEIARSFEASFLSEDLSKQLTECDRFELAPLFLQLFRDKQPVLEAGCGSGRWCGWFFKNGIRSDGVEWSRELCRRAQSEIPNCRFVPCDMEQSPFKNGCYGGLIALGSIEHNAKGPVATLKEFHRVMRPGAVAVITVPFGGRLRRMLGLLVRPIVRCKGNNFIRRLYGKRPVHGTTFREAKRGTNGAWDPRFGFGEHGWFFYEYEFNKTQMRKFLADAGFEIQREFIGFGNEGLLHNFGPLAGRWNHERGDVDFTALGTLFKRIIPVSIVGHMLCYVVQKPSQ
jgi:SAM-dependent methyltransferase